MRSIIRYFIKYPMYANAFIFVISLFGIYSMFSMNKSFFPELDPRRVIVSVLYPGASPEEMEEGVTIKVEQALRGINGVEQINSTSSENVAMITVQAFESADMDEVYKDVENAVNSINSFPQGAEKPVIRRLKLNPVSEMVSTIGLTGDGDFMTLKEEADKIENDLFNSGLISNIEMRGFPELELVVAVQEENLLKYGIMIDEIALAIQRNNQDLTGGILRNDKEELVIRSRKRTTDPKEIEKIVVRTTPSGQKILVEDVADVSLGFSETSAEVYYLGKRSISIEIKKTPDQDLGAITEYIREYVAAYNKEYHPAKLHIQYEAEKNLQDRIDLLTSNGMMGLALVLLMLGLFLSTRVSIWVAFGIPFAFLGMFIVAVMMGLTINMITLFGMILVVGILVDDAIVIAENIVVHFERGKTPHQAALDGTAEVLPSVISSLLTTIAAFSMLLAVEKMEMMWEMPVVVILALAFSMLEGFITLPVHMASHKVLSRPKEGTFRFKARKLLNGIVDYLRDEIFAEMQKFVFKRYRAFVVLPLIFTFAIIILSIHKKIGYTFFPEIKPEIINVEVAFVPGTAKDITMKWLKETEAAIVESNQEIIDLCGDTLMTKYTMTVGMSQSLGETGFHTGMFTLTIEGEGKAMPVDSLQRRIMEKIYANESTKLTEGIFVGAPTMTFGKPVEYSLTGNNDEEVRKARDLFKKLVEEIPLISNLKDNEPLGRKEINLEMKPEADFYNLGVYEVTKQIRQGVFGQEVQRVILGTDEVKIWVRYDQAGRQDQYDLENLRIKTMDGKQILLSDLADYTIERGPVSLKRRDGRREIVVDASVDDPEKVGDVNGIIVKEVIPQVEAQYPGVEVIQRGQGERSSKALASMGINLAILFVIMILMISLTFRSVYQGLLIMLVIPAGVAGGILGHTLIGIPVSILSAFGMIALIGILVNDAIVFLDQYNRNLRDGLTVKDAVFEAARSRFRPILLTSVTTVAGMMPLIMETSFQAQFLIPMAAMISFGLVFGTLFILLFFPCIILASSDFRRGWNFAFNGSTVTTPVVEVQIDELDNLSIEKSQRKNKSNMLFRTVLLNISTYLYFIPIIAFITFPKPDSGVVSQIVFYIFTAATLVLFVIFPDKLFNRIIQKIWSSRNIQAAEKIEPALLNKEEEDKRSI
ncbi:MAG: efflux RND transporter permease subunit [Crocinitomicaceae bacterium]|nr:efflux RND transporter permease subunit [Crocinitomicaceae bacterium]